MRYCALVPDQRREGRTIKYVAVSGGADSTALALLLAERGEEFELVFADTGAELPEVYWLLPRLAKTIGKRLNVVNNGTYFQHVASHGFFLPGPRMRWCTRLLKQVPQDRFFESVQPESVAIGIRADEAHRVNSNKRGNWEWRYPLVEAGMDKAAVKALCQKYDLLNPCYQWRTNVSCFCCFFQRKSDWLGLLKHHPTLYRLAEEWENQALSLAVSGWAFNQSFTLRQLREADEHQLRLWPEECTDAEPCLICRI